jgi:hypothetical protein
MTELVFGGSRIAPASILLLWVLCIRADSLDPLAPPNGVRTQALRFWLLLRRTASTWQRGVNPSSTLHGPWFPSRQGSTFVVAGQRACLSLNERNARYIWAMEIVPGGIPEMLLKQEVGLLRADQRVSRLCVRP